MSLSNVVNISGGGGLAPKGTLTADTATVEGIYNLDASAVAFTLTLPAATGSQSRRKFVGAAFGTGSTINNITVAVQVGEKLNNTIGGTYKINTIGGVWDAIDVAVGQWSIIPVASNRTYQQVYDGGVFGHGFSNLQPIYAAVVGTWELATSGLNAANGLVTRIIDNKTFEVTTHGLVYFPAHGLTIGSDYYLSAAGTLTTTAPTTGIRQHIVKVVSVDTLFVNIDSGIDTALLSTPKATYFAPYNPLGYVPMAAGANFTFDMDVSKKYVDDPATKIGNPFGTSFTLAAGRYKLVAGLSQGTAGAVGSFIWKFNGSNAFSSTGFAVSPTAVAAGDSSIPAVAYVNLTAVSTVTLVGGIAVGSPTVRVDGSYITIEEL